jgi:hypothetical protein
MSVDEENRTCLICLRRTPDEDVLFPCANAKCTYHMCISCVAKYPAGTKIPSCGCRHATGFAFAFDSIQRRRALIPLDLEEWLVERCASPTPVGYGWPLVYARRCVWALADFFRLKDAGDDERAPFCNMRYVPSPPVDLVWALYCANGVRANAVIDTETGKDLDTAREGPPAGVHLCEDPRYYRTCIALGALTQRLFALDETAWPDQPRQAPLVDIAVADKAGTSYALCVDTTWTIAFLKAVLSGMCHVHLADDQLAFKSVRLDDGCTLQACNVGKGARMKLVSDDD